MTRMSTFWKFSVPAAGSCQELMSLPAEATAASAQASAVSEDVTRSLMGGWCSDRPARSMGLSSNGVWPQACSTSARAPPRRSLMAIGHSLQHVGRAAWSAFQAVNTRVPASEPVTRPWAPGPLLKSRQRSRPPLSYPRETDSLCPRCVVETRSEILSGERNVADLVDGHLG